jgi:hypothetical protein
MINFSAKKNCTDIKAIKCKVCTYFLIFEKQSLDPRKSLVRLEQNSSCSRLTQNCIFYGKFPNDYRVCKTQHQENFPENQKDTEKKFYLQSYFNIFI